MARSSLLLAAAAVALGASSILASLPGGASGATAGRPPLQPRATTSSLMWNTGRYGTDPRPHGVARDAKIVPGTGAGGAALLRFEAPGANWYEGSVKTYRLVTLGSSGKTIRDFTIQATASAGRTQTIVLPKGAVSVVVQAENSDGLLSEAVQVTGVASHVVAWPS